MENTVLTSTIMFKNNRIVDVFALFDKLSLFDIEFHLGSFLVDPVDFHDTRQMKTTYFGERPILMCDGGWWDFAAKGAKYYREILTNQVDQTEALGCHRLRLFLTQLDYKYATMPLIHTMTANVIKFVEEYCIPRQVKICFETHNSLTCNDAFMGFFWQSLPESIKPWVGIVLDIENCINNRKDIKPTVGSILEDWTTNVHPDAISHIHLKPSSWKMKNDLKYWLPKILENDNKTIGLEVEPHMNMNILDLINWNNEVKSEIKEW